MINNIRRIRVRVFRLGLLFVLLRFTGSASGQLPNSTPDPNEAQRIRAQQQIEIRKNIEDQARHVREMTTNNTPKMRPADPRASERIKAIYRKTNNKEADLLAPAKEDLDSFAEFLRQPKTGLIKLVPDKGCSESTNVVVAAGNCLVYTMPGAGHSYSFRVQDYRIPRLADINFTNDEHFESKGLLQHGIFVNIGDVPLSEVNLQTKGLKILVDFIPRADVKMELEDESKLVAGIRSEGFVYARRVDVVEDATFVLRSIAFRGRYMRSIGGVMFDEMEIDKRKDVIVAFRIIRRHEDGAITILWKQLLEQDSPRSNWGEKNTRDAPKPQEFSAEILFLTNFKNGK